MAGADVGNSSTVGPHRESRRNYGQRQSDKVSEWAARLASHLTERSSAND